MSDELEISVSVPLDNDRFLRRECPTCEREFKWLPSDDSEPAARAGYFCPYCAVQAPEGDWLTQAQVDYVRDAGLREVAGPLFQRLDRTARRIGGKFEGKLPDQPQELTEDDDMRRVDFSCHPQEPLKVLSEWSDPVHCLLCGQRVE